MLKLDQQLVEALGDQLGAFFESLTDYTSKCPEPMQFTVYTMIWDVV
jgi:hypothetical protein